MSLESVPGQSRAKRFLRQLLRSGHLPHALLFSGMAGIGKTAMARELAKVLNCAHSGAADCCDHCTSCRKIDGGQHPDLVWIRSDKTFIKLDQVREVRERLRFRPFEGKWRVVVFEEAHKLKEEAANALLKLLEEPPQQNLLLLSTLEPQMLLPTIVSRCCHLRFQPLETQWIEQQLVASYQVPVDRAEEVARLAEGSLERARWLVEDNRIASWEEISRKLRQLDGLPMHDFFAQMAEWAKQSEDLEQDLEYIKLWVRDIILTRLRTNHSPVLAGHGNGANSAADVSVDCLFELYDQIEQAMRHLRQNANKQLTLEGVCLAIKDNLYGQGSWNTLQKRREDLSF